MAKPGRPSRAVIHQRLADEVNQLRTRFGGLPSPEEAEGIWNDIWYSEAHGSTAIEGNTLSSARSRPFSAKGGRLATSN